MKLRIFITCEFKNENAISRETAEIDAEAGDVHLYWDDPESLSLYVGARRREFSGVIDFEIRRVPE